MEVRLKITALYESVTQSIINDLEAGVASWVKPWKDGNTGDILPMNAATKRDYNGVNIPILWHAQIRKGYSENDGEKKLYGTDISPKQAVIIALDGGQAAQLEDIRSNHRA
jgi:hypothetical protein